MLYLLLYIPIIRIIFYINFMKQRKNTKRNIRRDRKGSKQTSPNNSKRPKKINQPIKKKKQSSYHAKRSTGQNFKPRKRKESGNIEIEEEEDLNAKLLRLEKENEQWKEKEKQWKKKQKQWKKKQKQWSKNTYKKNKKIKKLQGQLNEKIEEKNQKFFRILKQKDQYPQLIKQANEYRKYQKNCVKMSYQQYQQSCSRDIFVWADESFGNNLQENKQKIKEKLGNCDDWVAKKKYQQFSDDYQSYKKEVTDLMKLGLFMRVDEKQNFDNFILMANIFNLASINRTDLIVKNIHKDRKISTIPSISNAQFYCQVLIRESLQMFDQQNRNAAQQVINYIIKCRPLLQLMRDHLKKYIRLENKNYQGDISIKAIKNKLLQVQVRYFEYMYPLLGVTVCREERYKIWINILYLTNRFQFSKQFFQSYLFFTFLHEAMHYLYRALEIIQPMDASITQGNWEKQFKVKSIPQKEGGTVFEVFLFGKRLNSIKPDDFMVLKDEINKSDNSSKALKQIFKKRQNFKANNFNKNTDLKVRVGNIPRSTLYLPERWCGNGQTYYYLNKK